ncbi:MAG: hypothetical protein RL060_1979 [Bacteroidota bacterium]
MKNLFLLLLWLPFVLMTDLFPFMRFGMFAEPVKTTRQTEFFIITLERGNTEKVIDPNTSGIPVQTLNYLARNSYYQQRADELLRTVAQSEKIEAKDILRLQVITIQNTEKQADTTLISTFIKS